jgi:hypothetical protein
MEKIFQNLDPIGRIRALEDNADQTLKDETFDRHLTADELAAMHNDFAKNHLEIARLETEKAELSATLNYQIKQAKKAARQQLETLRTGRETVTETVYLMSDFLQKKMLTYDQTGALVASRPLRAAEQQYKIELDQAAGF